jgi:hypothetical protein
MSYWEVKGGIKEMKAADDEPVLHCDCEIACMLLIRTSRCAAFRDSFKPVKQTTHFYHNPGLIDCRNEHRHPSLDHDQLFSTYLTMNLRPTHNPTFHITCVREAGKIHKVGLTGI